MNANLKKGMLFMLLAIIVEGCALMATPSSQATPPPENIVPQTPLPDNPPPGGPPQGGPAQGGPDQGGPQQGGDIWIEFLSDPAMLQPGQCASLQWSVQGIFIAVRLDGQPVDPVGERQVCPKATAVYRLEVDTGKQIIPREVVINVGGGKPPAQTKPAGGGPGPAATPTVKSGGGPGPANTATPKVPQIGTVLPLKMFLDLGLMKIWGDSGTGNIMATFTNLGTISIVSTVKMQCTADWGKCDVCQKYSTSVSAPLNLAPGISVRIDTGLDLVPALMTQKVQCSFTPPSGDANPANDSLGPVKVK